MDNVLLKHAWPAYVWPFCILVLSIGLTIGIYLSDRYGQIIVTEIGMPFFTEIYGRIFPIVKQYFYAIPAFLSLWSFTIFLRRKMWSARIANGRITMQSGVIIRHIDNIELYRVMDMSGSGHIWRLFGVGNITLYSHDITAPCIMMPWIHQYTIVIDTLRGEIERQRRHAGIVGAMS